MQRIDVLDVLRGFALLGLPLMNLVAFSMPFSAYINPQAFHGDNTLNHFWFSLFYIFADQKFMGIFSVLFGAGLALLYEKFKSEPSVEKQRGAGTIYIRLFVLLIFGYLHLNYLWSGDILMFYAAWGMVLFPFIGSSKKGLTILFVVLYSIVILGALGTRFDAEGLSQNELSQISVFFKPTVEQAEHLIEIYRGSLSDIANFESSLTVDDKEMGMGVLLILMMDSISALVRAGAMIALGFLLYKNGFLTGKWSEKSYKMSALIGIAIGIIVSYLGLIYNYSHDYSDPQQYFGLGNTFIVISSPFMVLGYIALVQILLNRSRFARWTQAVAKVGRMALTMYLMQSVIGVFLFWGVGLAWFGHVDRTELVFITLCIALTQISIASIWLKYFQYGPMEWLWRCLTYRSFVNILKLRKPELA
ncbi:hypothetical protein SOPP22_18820 [Shewanella sp. OPT22]|nr:hypothetical protein SOPP22_18820 [Shewanella sp. OPT22]